jgi:hypothetical protein
VRWLQPLSSPGGAVRRSQRCAGCKPLRLRPPCYLRSPCVSHAQACCCTQPANPPLLPAPPAGVCNLQVELWTEEVTPELGAGAGLIPQAALQNKALLALQPEEVRRWEARVHAAMGAVPPCACRAPSSTALASPVSATPAALLRLPPVPCSMLTRATLPCRTHAGAGQGGRGACCGAAGV